jgi:hypothetical protein
MSAMIEDKTILVESLRSLVAGPRGLILITGATASDADHRLVSGTGGWKECPKFWQGGRCVGPSRTEGLGNIHHPRHVRAMLGYPRP